MTTRRGLLAIAALAASIRGFALWADAGSLLHDVGGLDAPQYLDMARRFVAGTWPDELPFFWAPGYSLFLGLSMKVSASLAWLKTANIVLGCATCLLVGVLASRLFDSTRVALCSALIAALYGPLVYYDLQISPASLDVFLHVSWLVLLMAARDRDRIWLWLVAGIVAAASMITRGDILLLVPVVVVWMSWSPSPTTMRAPLRHAARLAALLLPVGLVWLLVVQHNVQGNRAWAAKTPSATLPPSSAVSSASGGVALSYNFGINFLLGNVPELHAINRVEHPMCFLEYKMLVYSPVAAGAATPAAQSSYLTQRALSSIRARPADWLQLMGDKLFELVHGEEISRDTSLEASRLDNPVLAALMWKHGLAFPSGVLIPLSLLGMAFVIRRSTTHRFMLAVFATQALFIVAFFVTTRYRLALWTTAIPYAAHAACEIFDGFRTWLHTRSVEPRARPRVAAIAIALLALFGVSNCALHPAPTRHLAFEYDHLGHMLDQTGKHDDAARQWQNALSVDPRYPQAHFQLASYYSKRSDAKAAAAHFEAGLRAAPTIFPARIEYAQLLIAQARTDDAAAQLRLVLQQAPSASLRSSVCFTAWRAHLKLHPECDSR